MYGKELILDLHDCDPSTFTRESIEEYFKRLCEKIDMERCDLHYWDDEDTPEGEEETEPHLVGISAVQFIKTSNIVIHTLPLLKKVFVNIFSCKEFYNFHVEHHTETWFKGNIIGCTKVDRI